MSKSEKSSKSKKGISYNPAIGNYSQSGRDGLARNKGSMSGSWNPPRRFSRVKGK